MRAFSVAQEDQQTFTDLVRQLVAGCSSDVEKARAIFRWITVKNLNSIMFEDAERGDTPMGLLRGIKFGTESYHVLFKRLCRLEVYFFCIRLRVKFYSFNLIVRMLSIFVHEICFFFHGYH